MVRIRNKAKIKELDIPKDNLEKLEEILSSNNISKAKKHDAIRQLTGRSPCCVCFESYASLELQYPVKGGAGIIVERYCSKCIDGVFERTKFEPEEIEKIAEYYGCQIGDTHAKENRAVRGRYW